MTEKNARAEKANKTKFASQYRPMVELDCPLIRFLYQEEGLAVSPVLVADIGAARGFDSRWDMFGKFCNQIGFEPEPAELERLQQQYSGDPSKKILPYAVADTNGRRTLYITRDADSSSLYKPNKSFFSRWPDPTINEEIGQVEVDVRTLDSLGLPSIDVLKMDIQGAELDVVVGSESLVQDHVVAIISEVEFTPEYENQPLFSDLDKKLQSLGFQLFDLDARRWRKRKLSSSFDPYKTGQVVYGDVLYLKDPFFSWDRFCAAGLERHKLLSLVALTEFFSVPDYGIELLELALAKKFITQQEQEVLTLKLESNVIVTVNERFTQRQISLAKP